MSILVTNISRRLGVNFDSTFKTCIFKTVSKEVPCCYSSIVLYHKQTKNNFKTKHKNTYWPWLSVSGLFVGFLSLKVYFQKCTVSASEIDPKSSIFQPVKSGTGGSSKRSVYNFVADVVDIVGNAVVYIERQQRFVSFSLY